MCARIKEVHRQKAKMHMVHTCPYTQTHNTQWNKMSRSVPKCINHIVCGRFDDAKVMFQHYYPLLLLLAMTDDKGLFPLHYAIALKPLPLILVMVWEWPHMIKTTMPIGKLFLLYDWTCVFNKPVKVITFMLLQFPEAKFTIRTTWASHHLCSTFRPEIKIWKCSLLSVQANSNLLATGNIWWEINIVWTTERCIIWITTIQLWRKSPSTIRGPRVGPA